MSKRTKSSKVSTMNDETFDMRYFNRELKYILTELDDILKEYSGNECANNEYANNVKQVTYIRKKRNNATNFIDIIIKEQQRIEKEADKLLEEK